MKSKVKTFSVNYSTLWHYESVVKAKNKKEAIAKVKEVVDLNDNEIGEVWEIKGGNDV